MARTRDIDWLECGLRILCEGGEAALTIERLCSELKRTKGAFYHHFEDVNAYFDALLELWEAKQTALPMEQANAALPAQRRRALDTAVRALDMKLDLAVRAWGLRDPRTRAFVARVDERRVAYLTELADPELPLRERRTLARLEYMAFLGAQQLFPDLRAPAARETERALHAALTALKANAPAARRKQR
jgi:AcrR family transcriptional regulator